MSSPERPIYFYVFRTASDYKIVEMTDEEAAIEWQKGKRWIDIAKRTLREAIELRRHLRATMPVED